MAELSRNSSQTIYLDIHGGYAQTTPTVVLKRSGKPDAPLVVGPKTTLPDGDGERWSSVIGFQYTQEDTELKVVWDFVLTSGEPARKTEYYDVVTTYVDIEDIREELEIDVDITDAQLVRAERKARRLIDNYCGQNFGLCQSTETVRGNGTGILRLPKRLVTLSDITNIGNGLELNYTRIVRDGWGIQRLYDYDEEILTTNPIFNPFTNFGLNFSTDIEWSIAGTWGWERVPSEVYDTTLLLVEQELAPESIYRDKYVKDMRTSDFAFSVASDSFNGTGNASADQMLSRHVVSRVRLI